MCLGVGGVVNNKKDMTEICLCLNIRYTKKYHVRVTFWKCEKHAG